MTIYYKATRPDGTDFHTGTIRYEVGQTVTHPSANRVEDDPATYLSVSTAPTDCTGFSWPCRLFTVEGHGRSLRATNLPNKRCFSSLTVVEEMPAFLAFGPQGEQVVAVLERCQTVTADEAARLGAAWDATWAATWGVPWGAAWCAAWGAALAAARCAARCAALAAARDALRDATWAATWGATWGAARGAARGAAKALLVRDLITREQFDRLYGPWASVIGEPA